mmetsp:Transcript_7924/g.24462  ORF Transcript_7924/g.24462 Transcript_7924/m.24462 type:complete len:100 (+) Transcript_7924:449-748(+)
MKNLFEKDNKKRLILKKKEKLRIALKFLCTNQNLNLNTRWFLNFKFEKLSSKNNNIQLRNRCVKTYRSKSVVRSFRLSRIFFRNFAVFGKINGLIKESW